ncbi:hypothetical protein EJB05_57690 [Eragrostis curvula]|uniref:Uncharacterized protein n=1 Tax=Eragrostis curvula TaxID=38414 RepID=A0A5J9SDB8_9POAL|nr:hypothetical protein EJB05_57690 [Eragrostis curvula]
MAGRRRNRGRQPQHDARVDGAEMEDESHDGTPRRFRNLQDIDARQRDQDRELRHQVQTLVQQMAAMQTQMAQIADTRQRRDMPEDQGDEDASYDSDGSSESDLRRPEAGLPAPISSPPAASLSSVFPNLRRAATQPPPLSVPRSRDSRTRSVLPCYGTASEAYPTKAEPSTPPGFSLLALAPEKPSAAAIGFAAGKPPPPRTLAHSEPHLALLTPAAWRSRRPSSPPLRPGKPIPIERRSSRELADPSTSSIRSRDAVRDAFFPVSGETSQPSPSSGTTSRTRPLLTGTSASQDHTKTAPAILDTPPSPHPAPGGHQQPTPVITVVTSSPRLPCSPEAPRTLQLSSPSTKANHGEDVEYQDEDDFDPDASY